MSEEQQPGGLDVDPIESKIYDGGSETFCIKCGRLRTKKPVYQLNDGSFRCYDNTTHKRGINEGVVCAFLSMVFNFCKTNRINLTLKTKKQLEKWISDQA